MNLPPPSSGAPSPTAATTASWPPPAPAPPPPAPVFAPVRPEVTLPSVAAWGAIGVLTISLVASKLLLEALIGFDWPVVVYVAILATVAYGPSLWWCRYVSTRWGTGRLGHDIGLTPRWTDLAWGPVLWFGAIGAQLAVAALVLALDIPLENNTEAIGELDADRTYVVALVISAVIAAPIVEEMVFRGVVMRGLRSIWPVVLVIPVQGVLFGAAHVDPTRGAGNIGLVMVLSGVGIAFGIGAHLLRRIGPAVVAHAIFNGVVLVILLTGLADRLSDL